MQKFINNAITNWKTTAAGLSLILGSIVHLIFSIHSGTLNENGVTAVITATLAGLGFIFAGDASASLQSGTSSQVVTPGQPTVTSTITQNTAPPSAPK